MGAKLLLHVEGGDLDSVLSELVLCLALGSHLAHCLLHIGSELPVDVLLLNELFSLSVLALSQPLRSEVPEVLVVDALNVVLLLRLLELATEGGVEITH